jgi:hypothetical protein
MPKAEAVKGIADAIRAAIPLETKRNRRWFEKIPADVLAELEAVRQDLRDGRLPDNKSAVARAIVDQLAAMGFKDGIGIQGVIAWLHGR